jgi:flagellar protein FlaG
MNVDSIVGGTVQIGRSGGTASGGGTPVAADTPVPLTGGSAPVVQTAAAGNLSAEDLARISAELQQKADMVALQIRFAVDQSNGKTVIRVTDGQTNKLIRQIPSEEALQIAKSIDEFQRHLLLDQKA